MIYLGGGRVHFPLEGIIGYLLCIKPRCAGHLHDKDHSDINSVRGDQSELRSEDQMLIECNFRKSVLDYYILSPLKKLFNYNCLKLMKQWLNHPVCLLSFLKRN